MASNTGGLVAKSELLEFFKDIQSTNTSQLTSSFQFFNKIESLLDAENASTPAENLLKWSQMNKKSLKVVSSDVPSSVISNDATLHDIKVFSKGPDDKVYDQNATLRAKIARGNCVLEQKKPDGKSKSYDLVVYALRKFTGGMGDEDEIDRASNDWEKYFVKDSKHSRYVACLQKANGEAAHLACRYIDNQFCLFAGSKNVHLAFRKKNDINMYSNEERYTYAKKIAKAIADHLDNMDSRKRELFLSFLCWSKLTCVFEILIPTSQHVEDLSYLSEPLLKFIVFTDNVIKEKPTNLCVHPKLSIEIAKLFDFSCVAYKEFPIEEIERQLIEVRKAYGYEGDVLYFMDSSHDVIGLLKKKTVWYIILRAIREKLRNTFTKRGKDGQSIAETRQKMSKRLQAIQKWIGFSDTERVKWDELCQSFIDWFAQQFKANKVDLETFNSRYPVLWTQFLKETGKSDQIELTLQQEFTWTPGNQELATRDIDYDLNDIDNTEDKSDAELDQVQVDLASSKI